MKRPVSLMMTTVSGLFAVPNAWFAFKAGNGYEYPGPTYVLRAELSS